MKRFTALFTITLALAVGCGGDDDGPATPDGGGNPGDPDAGEEEPANGGFVTPTVGTTAWEEVDGVWTEVGPANWDCLGTPSTDEPTSVAITLTGVVSDFQSGDPVPNADITAYDDTDFAAAGIATATSSDPAATFTMELPAGVERVAFKVSEPSVALDTFLLNQYFAPDDAEQSAGLNSVSILTANALPAFIGVTRTPGLGVLAAAIRDCDLNEVSGAIATVSSTSGSATHLQGAQTFYFSAGSTSLPVRQDMQATTNKDGLFVVIELPPSATAYLQVWGFTADQDPATDELTLLGEIPAPVLPDSVITASMEALRSN